MTSIDQLRSTLDEHAAALVDGEVVARRASVRARVAVVRRRRRAAAAGAAAGVVAVLAVVGGIVTLPGGTTPAPASRVVGVDVPAELESLGYVYELDRAVSGDGGTATVELPDSDETRLVAWATSGPDQSVAVRGVADQELHPDDADFSTWLSVPGGGPSTITVTARSGEVGVAVYTLGDERPRGYTKGGVTFRQDVAGGELAGALVGDAGQARLTLPVVATGQEMWVRLECAGAPRGARYDVTRDGEQFLVDGRCGDSIPVDLSGLTGMGFATTPGEQTTLEAIVTDASGAPVEAPDLRVALGVYSEQVAPGRVFAPEIETYGHTWRLVDVQQTAGAPALDTVTPSGGLVYASFTARRVDARVEPGGPGQGSLYLSRGSGTGALLDAGQPVRLEVDGGEAASGSVLVGFYTRAD